MTKKSGPPLSELTLARDLHRVYPALFPSQGSIDHQLRTYRAQYLKAGALYMIGGRLMAHPATFEAVTLQLGAHRLVEHERGKHAGCERIA